MKHFKRPLLLALALAASSILEYGVLPDFDPLKLIIFTITCLILGTVFYQIDKKISEK